MNFAKRCCSDDANLCEIISVVPEHDGNAKAFIEQLFKDNQFESLYREQLEKISAMGTAGAYIYLEGAKYLEHNNNVKVKGGKIRINYVDADCILPLTVDNRIVTECAFCGSNRVKGKEITTLVIFSLGDNGLYTSETVLFNSHGEEQGEGSILQLGEVKPFSVLTNAEVNNLDDMEGYGLPKLYTSIPILKIMDLCYNVLFSDLDKAEKLILINDLLCEFDKETGKPIVTPEQKKLFLFLHEKLPDQKDVIQEYNPEIRIDAITKCFELALSLLSMSFGYGTKKYTFENGKITTATEYIGEKQDSMQELNKQRKNAADYINDIVHAAMWFSNQFHGTSFNVEESLSTEFDDSYIEDKVAKLEQMRADALSFPEIPWLTREYLKEKYNLSDAEVLKYIEEGKADQEPEEEAEE